MPRNVFIASGTETYFGKTAKLVEEAKTKSHFQKAVVKIGDYLIAYNSGKICINNDKMILNCLYIVGVVSPNCTEEIVEPSLFRRSTLCTDVFQIDFLLLL
jgi:hypothetical protein